MYNAPHQQSVVRKTLNTLWNAVRSVLAVVAGITAMTLIAFAIEIPASALALRFLPETFPDRAALDISVTWMLSQSLYTIPALIFGGYVAAALAPHRRLAHAIAMAVVQDLLIVALIFNPPHPVPGWMWAISLILTPIAIIFGGYMAEPFEANPADQTFPLRSNIP